MTSGLFNAPATFQRYVMDVFTDIVEKFVEVFMEDFLVFGSSYDDCLKNLAKLLARCEETNCSIGKNATLWCKRVLFWGIKFQRVELKLTKPRWRKLKDCYHLSL